jgi:DNA polymerase III subunit gamma/tau
VPATIVSRCQRFDLTRVRLPDLLARLRTIATEEGVQIDDEALALAGRAATGSLRDGVNLMEQLVASFGQSVTAAQAREGLGLTGDGRALDLARMALRGELAQGLALVGAVRDDGVDLRRFTREVLAQLRAVLLLRAGIEEGTETDAAALDALRALAAETELPAITRALKAFGSADFRNDPQASLPLELALAEVTLGAHQAEPAAPSFAEAREIRGAEQTAPVRVQRTAARPRTAPVVEPQAAPGAAATTPPPEEQYADQISALKEHVSGRGATPARPSEPIVRAERDEEAKAPPREQTTSPPAERDREAGSRDDAATPTLDEARARYREIYERLQSMNRLFAAWINTGDIVAVDGRTVSFGLPHHSSVIEKLAPGSRGHSALREAVSQVFEREYDVQCVHKTDVEDRLRALPTRRSHLLDEALKLGAQPLDAR